MKDAWLAAIDDKYLYVRDEDGDVFKLKIEKHIADDFISLEAKWISSGRKELRKASLARFEESK